ASAYVDTSATSVVHARSLHDALPISVWTASVNGAVSWFLAVRRFRIVPQAAPPTLAERAQIVKRLSKVRQMQSMAAHCQAIPAAGCPMSRSVIPVLKFSPATSLTALH